MAENLAHKVQLNCDSQDLWFNQVFFEVPPPYRVTELLLCCLHRTGAPFGIVAVRNGAPFHALAVVLVLQGALKGGSPELEMKDSFNLVPIFLILQPISAKLRPVASSCMLTNAMHRPRGTGSSRLIAV